VEGELLKGASCANAVAACPAEMMKLGDAVAAYLGL
jgi:hypothetical protein